MTLEILRSDQISNGIQTEVSALYDQLDSNIKQLQLRELLATDDNLVFVICKVDDKVAGIASMAIYKVISGHKGMVEDVVVDQEYRGRGIGRKLMEKLLDEAQNRNLDEVLLFSAHYRTPAITLYKSLGFRLKDSGLYRLVFN